MKNNIRSTINDGEVFLEATDVYNALYSYKNDLDRLQDFIMNIIKSTTSKQAEIDEIKSR